MVLDDYDDEEWTEEELNQPGFPIEYPILMYQCFDGDNWTKEGLYQCGFPFYSKSSINSALDYLSKKKEIDFYQDDFDDKQRKQVFEIAGKYELSGSVEETENLPEIKNKSKNLEELSLGIKAATKVTTKLVKGAYETGRFLIESLLICPTRTRKNRDIACLSDESTPIFCLIELFSLGAYLEDTDKPYLAAIPLATNIASGLYELYRHEKNKLKTELPENKKEDLEDSAFEKKDVQNFLSNM